MEKIETFIMYRHPKDKKGLMSHANGLGGLKKRAIAICILFKLMKEKGYEYITMDLLMKRMKNLIDKDDVADAMSKLPKVFKNWFNDRPTIKNKKLAEYCEKLGYSSEMTGHAAHVFDHIQKRGYLEGCQPENEVLIVLFTLN